MTEPPAPRRTCSTCGSLPATVLANTGRNELLPEAATRLRTLVDGGMQRFRECPECRAVFFWEDLPQMYGSGNLDEEQLTRLPEREGRLLRFFASRPDPRSAETARRADEAFAVLPPERWSVLLGQMVFRETDLFSVFVPQLARILASGGSARAATLLNDYSSRSAPRAAHALAELERHAGEDRGRAFRYVLECCRALARKA